jgi:hypothetical protein
MKTSGLKRISLMVLFVGVLCVEILAQQQFVLQTDESELKITGTSSLHDWQMKAEKYTCSVVATASAGKGYTIKSAEFSLQANSIKSDNSIMDSKAHEALSVKKSPVIKFSSSASDQLLVISGSEYSGYLSGNLTIGGKSNTVKLPVKGSISTDNSMVFNGVVELKMSDFGIDPPTALLGTLKTGDAVKLHYRFVFKVSKVI